MLKYSHTELAFRGRGETELNIMKCTDGKQAMDMVAIQSLQNIINDDGKIVQRGYADYLVITPVWINE